MKAIIFDMDDLMIESERLYQQAQQEIARKFDKKMTEDMRHKLMGRKPIESIRIFVKELDIPLGAEEILQMRNEIMREKLKNDLTPMPGLDHIIHSFYGILKLAVATGAQKEFLDLVVDKLGLREKFDVLQDSDELLRGKPHPEIYLKTCEKLALHPGCCIVLEDSTNGARAAKNAGCYVLAVPTKYTNKQDFSFADATVNDLFAAAEHIRCLISAA